MFKNFLQVSKI